MAWSFLVRYGLARAVARFAVEPDQVRESPALADLDRGDLVVVRTHRGVELGEVLGAAPDAFDADCIPETGSPGPQAAPILRAATTADRAQARRAEARRDADFAAAATVFRAGAWPIDLIDAEPLLEEGRTVLHYLGPHRLDAAGLVAIFRAQFGLDVVLEPVGRDIAEDEIEANDEPEPADTHACGSCGSGGGGCGSCGSAASCSLKALVGRRQPRSAALIP